MLRFPGKIAKVVGTDFPAMRMEKGLLIFFLLAFAFLGACAEAIAPQQSPAPLNPSRSQFPDSKYHGMSYEYSLSSNDGVGYGSEASAQSLRRLKELGVNWISITPFGFQRTPQDTAIGRFAAESDESMLAVTEQAHALGMKVMMKPHIWLRRPFWVGDIEHHSEEAWAAWFKSYHDFIVHFAELAKVGGMDALCIGNELEKTSIRDAEWRGIIKAVRAVYHGPLTYGATAEEVFAIKFWDTLDFIGVSAYYSLVNARTAALTSLVDAWQPILARLSALSIFWQKNVVFTEIGYRSADFGAWQHWQIEDSAPVNLQLQANAYAAFFEAVWPQPWFGGVYWWKWPSSNMGGGPENNDFTPINKPAESVLRKNYIEESASRRN